MTPLSFEDWIFILRGHKKVFDGMTSLQMHFNPIFFASSLEALTQPLMVRDHNMCFSPLLLFGAGFLLFGLFIFWSAWLFIFTLFNVQFGYLHLFRDLIGVFFIFQMIWVRSDCSSPMIQSSNYTVLGSDGVMTIPVQVLVCVSWLSVDLGV